MNADPRDSTQPGDGQPPDVAPDVAVPSGGGEEPGADQAGLSASLESEAAALALADMQDRWRRALADLDNLRKRCQREVADARASERSRVAGELLPVVDNLELALQHAAADPASIVAGVQAVREQALSTLARLGFERIDDTGARFDPTRHEAATVVPDPDSEPGTVVGVLRPGYSAPGGLLRPAVVAVSQRPAPAADESGAR